MLIHTHYDPLLSIRPNFSSLQSFFLTASIMLMICISSVNIFFLRSLLIIQSMEIKRPHSSSSLCPWRLTSMDVRCLLLHSPAYWYTGGSTMVNKTYCPGVPLGVTHTVNQTLSPGVFFPGGALIITHFPFRSIRLAGVYHKGQ